MVWREQFRPLPVDLWRRELDRLSVWCANAIVDADERAVRRAFHLAMLAPMGIRSISSPAVTLRELENLLDNGETEPAARAVLGAAASADVARLPESDCWEASFSIMGDSPARFEASSAVRAMIGAWATFFRSAGD